MYAVLPSLIYCDITQSVSPSVGQYTLIPLRDFTQELLPFLCELEDIHIKTNVEGFQRSRKEGLVRTLWRIIRTNQGIAYVCCIA